MSETGSGVRAIDPEFSFEHLSGHAFPGKESSDQSIHDNFPREASIPDNLVHSGAVQFAPIPQAEPESDKVPVIFAGLQSPEKNATAVFLLQSIPASEHATFLSHRAAAGHPLTFPG
ncbi:MAG: hypothetical protein LUG93_15600 [Lachnospiraceae bacterium]|nr:hypothetical protein [Lachnospiraceae bacterium]